MSRTLHLVQELVARGEVRISEHGFDELSADGMVLQKDETGRAIHVVWGIAKNSTTPAVAVTAYRPEADKWSDDFRTRR